MRKNWPPFFTTELLMGAQSRFPLFPSPLLGERARVMGGASHFALRLINARLEANLGVVPSAEEGRKG